MTENTQVVLTGEEINVAPPSATAVRNVIALQLTASTPAGQRSVGMTFYTRSDCM